MSPEAYSQILRFDTRYGPANASHPFSVDNLKRRSALSRCVGSIGEESEASSNVFLRRISRPLFSIL
jgi:hypothetical protein